MVIRENGKTTIDDWQLAVAAFLLVACSGAIGSWVWSTIDSQGATIVEHDRALTTHTQQVRQLENQGDKVDGKLTRLEEKIGRIFEELRKK